MAELPPESAPEQQQASKPNEPFLIDAFDNGLVVIPAGEAKRLATLNDALEGSSTWGEFLASLDQDAKTQAYLDDAFEGELPGPEDPFDPDDIPGFADGDWPAWPKGKMLNWLPDSVKKLGTIERTAMSGLMLQLDEDLVDEVIAALAAEGIESYEDPDGLVLKACGDWRYC